MAKFKKNNYRFWHSPFVLLLLFLFLSFFIYSVINLIDREIDTSKKKEAILEEIEELKQKEQILNSNILKLKTEEGVEEIIREKYQVAKEGEKVIIIVDNDRDVNKKYQEETRHSFWRWFCDIFK